MKSKFQYKNPKLISLTYFAKEEEEISFDEGISVSMDITVGISEYSQEDNQTEVFLEVVLGRNDQSPFYIEAKNTALFIWENGIDDKKLKLLLNQNAPAVLLSFLRPIIKEVTSDLPYGSYYIPLIDFTSK